MECWLTIFCFFSKKMTRGCYNMELLTLSPKKNFDPSKLKELADDNFEFHENGGEFSKRAENNVGKGEIASNEQFLLFSLCFHMTYIADT